VGKSTKELSAVVISSVICLLVGLCLFSLEYGYGDWLCGIAAGIPIGSLIGLFSEK